MKESLDHDLEVLKITYGYRIGLLLVTEFGVLAFVIALGQVKAETSYGLGMVLGGLNTAIGAFAGWAWGIARASRKKDQDEEPKGETI